MRFLSAVPASGQSGRGCPKFLCFPGSVCHEMCIRDRMKDAAHTEWGLKYGYKDIKRYQDFQRVPIQTYEEIKPYVERMRHGEKDVLWRGEVQWFAKSSGPTNDKSKFIPVSREAVSYTHLMGIMLRMILYSKLFMS